MNSLLLGSLPYIKIEDDVIDLDYEAEMVPITTWDDKIRNMFIKGTDGKVPLEDLLKFYIRSLRGQMRVSKDKSLLKDKVLTHINYFHINYMELNDFLHLSNYYELMEDILANYCTLEFDLLRRKFPHRIRTRKKQYLPQVKQTLHQICTVLMTFLGQHDVHIVHVLLKMRYSKFSVVSSEVRRMLYTRVLFDKPISDRTEEDLCRLWIIFMKMKEVVAPYELSEIEKIFQAKYGVVELSRNSEVFRNVFYINKNGSRIANSLHVRDCAVQNYFCYLKLKRQKQDHNFIDTGAPDLCDNSDEEELSEKVFGKSGPDEDLPQGLIMSANEIVNLDDDDDDNEKVVVILSDNEDDENIPKKSNRRKPNTQDGMIVCDIIDLESDECDEALPTPVANNADVITVSANISSAEQVIVDASKPDEAVKNTQDFTDSPETSFRKDTPTVNVNEKSVKPTVKTSELCEQKPSDNPVEQTTNLVSPINKSFLPGLSVCSPNRINGKLAELKVSCGTESENMNLVLEEKNTEPSPVLMECDHTSNISEQTSSSNRSQQSGSIPTIDISSDALSLNDKNGTSNPVLNRFQEFEKMLLNMTPTSKDEAFRSLFTKLKNTLEHHLETVKEGIVKSSPEDKQLDEPVTTPGTEKSKDAELPIIELSPEKVTVDLQQPSSTDLEIKAKSAASGDTEQLFNIPEHIEYLEAPLEFQMKSTEDLSNVSETPTEIITEPSEVLVKTAKDVNIQAESMEFSEVPNDTTTKSVPKETTTQTEVQAETTECLQVPKETTTQTEVQAETTECLRVEADTIVCSEVQEDMEVSNDDPEAIPEIQLKTIEYTEVRKETTKQAETKDDSVQTDPIIECSEVETEITEEEMEVPHEDNEKLEAISETNLDKIFIDNSELLIDVKTEEVVIEFLTENAQIVHDGNGEYFESSTNNNKEIQSDIVQSSTCNKTQVAYNYVECRIMTPPSEKPTYENYIPPENQLSVEGGLKPETDKIEGIVVQLNEVGGIAQNNMNLEDILLTPSTSEGKAESISGEHIYLGNQTVDFIEGKEMLTEQEVVESRDLLNDSLFNQDYDEEITTTEFVIENLSFTDDVVNNDPIDKSFLTGHFDDCKDKSECCRPPIVILQDLKISDESAKTEQSAKTTSIGNCDKVLASVSMNDYIKPKATTKEQPLQSSSPNKVLFTSKETIAPPSGLDAFDEFQDSFSGRLTKINGANHHYENYNFFDCEKTDESFVKPVWELTKVGSSGPIGSSNKGTISWAPLENKKVDVPCTSDVESKQSYQMSSSTSSSPISSPPFEDISSTKGEFLESLNSLTKATELKGILKTKSQSFPTPVASMLFDLDVRAPYERLKRKLEEKDNPPKRIKIVEPRLRLVGVDPSDDKIKKQPRINLVKYSEVELMRRYLKSVRDNELERHHTKKRCILFRFDSYKKQEEKGGRSREGSAENEEFSIASPSRVPDPAKYLNEPPVTGPNGFLPSTSSMRGRRKNNVGNVSQRGRRKRGRARGAGIPRNSQDRQSQQALSNLRNT